MKLNWLFKGQLMGFFYYLKNNWYYKIFYILCIFKAGGNSYSTDDTADDLARMQTNRNHHRGQEPK